ncbi:MAG: D-2-hydroxyacid dehydrogenase [Deltaproteobacteria bacterium]|nr:D-2-hydroxyacid dehydrogenase [Deltaproteobacteria bacterium]MBI3066471.1 D-2-hydroxyacid dehydrogenase [Deltaproteobacteria bacterium]
MSHQRTRVVFLDAATYGDVSLKRFTECWDCTVHQVTTSNETIARIAGHSVVVTNKVVIDGTVLNAPEARELKLIAVAATGTDIIDREQAAKRGIKICNVPGYAAQSVAQFTMALILELATRVGKYGEAVKAGEWQKSPVFSLLTYPTIELNGKKLGIVGYGNIGQTVAKMSRGFGMEVLISARGELGRTARPGSESPIPRDRVPLEQVLREADVITLHCPLTPETRNLIKSQSLSLMKPTAFLINTARGALIDEAALVEALRNKRIAGAALDVISKEPPSADHPMVLAAKELDNLIVTPHTAWSAREARERLLREVEENILAFLRGEPRNLVN